MGYVFQNYYLLPELSALENVMVPGLIRGRKVSERATELLGAVGLEDRIHHLPAELSGGEQQRVAIARALVNDPATPTPDPSQRGTLLASGTRVSLRSPCLEDEEEYLELVRTSQELHRPWEPLPEDSAPSPTSSESFLAWLTGAEDPRTERMLLYRSSDGVIVGRFQLNEIVRGAFHSAYMSYWVGAPFAGQGFMREGMELTLQHAFTTLGLHRVEANIQPANAPSIALAKGAGFRLEGFSERYLKIAGEWADHERWAMTVEDWEARGSASGPSS